MQKYCFVVLLLLSFQLVFAQNNSKKPLDHSVYDGWQSIGEKIISNDGRIVAYTVNVQEGDGNLVLKHIYNEKELIIERGYNASFSNNNEFLVCKIKPTYQQTRDAKIKKKKPDEMPKDSLAIVNLTDMSVQKIARVKSYKMPQENEWLAWLHEKNENDKKADAEEGTLLCLRNLNVNVYDSFPKISNYVFDKKGNTLAIDRRGNKKDSILKNALIWIKMSDVKFDTLLKNYTDLKSITLNDDGTQLAFVATADTTKAEQKPFSLYYFNKELQKKELNNDTKGIPENWRINENANLSFSKTGNRLFFGTSPKIIAKDTSLPEFERVNVDVWHYNDDELQTVQLKNNDVILKRSYIAYYDFNTQQINQLGNEKFVRVQVPLEGDARMAYTSTNEGKRIAAQWQGFTMNDVYSVDLITGKQKLIKANHKGNVIPSYTGKYLLLYDEVKKQYELYNHATQQLKPFAKDIPFALYDEDNDVPDDANAYGIAKWMENDEYVLINDRYDVWKVATDGKQKSVALTNGRKEKVQHRYISFDEDEKFITAYQIMYFKLYHEVSKASGLLIRTTEIPYKYNFQSQDDAYYDAPDNIKYQRDSTKMKIVYYLQFMKPGYFKDFNKTLSAEINKQPIKLSNKKTTKVSTGNASTDLRPKKPSLNEPVPAIISSEVLENISNFVKAKNSCSFIYTMENYKRSSNLYFGCGMDTILVENANNPDYSDTIIQPRRQLSFINKQQEQYNWGTAELFQWKAYTGKLTEGVLYKPENFDAKKKYPMIVYFYERSNNTLHNYIAPAPTPSRLNIPFFVSRGYIVFVPDIWYVKGKPGQSAYDYIVSGTRAVVKLGFVDSTKIGLQGQSWGGYQIAHLITRTNLYAAAWAGAPVANMTSAYGGIRWGSGLNRQFQYEKSQSRIGATLWERQDLYLENSPLFHLPKVKTPLVIMHNDKDDAVPWYQGIELFTGLRRLGKKVWMLNYNDEFHNLVERKNRKDIQIREQQFFDWLLKGEKPAPWLEKGVPAIMKGRTMGYEGEY